MTSRGPRSDRNGKAEPAPPETYDPALNAYRSWELAMEELHALTVRLLKDDHT